MKIKTLLFSAFLLTAILPVLAQAQTDSIQSTKKADKIKKGWNFGGVPVIAYDSDIGFKYGAVVNVFNYGDGTRYPKYDHSLYFEWSRTTKGSGINQFIYDSERLIPGIRLSVEASLLTEQSLDFFGFNGYESYYNPDLEDEDSDNYLSRMYYNMDRKLTRLRADFQGKITGPKFRWLAGIEYSNAKMNTVDIEKLNKGKDDDELLPDTALLYDNYVAWGIIPEDQAKGGKVTLLKAGLVYDTRDIEANPMRGIWTEVQLLVAPAFMGSIDNSFTKLAITHRQYFTLAPQVLNFAYRLSYQTKLGGEMPYYTLPFVYNTAPNYTRDGVGGSKTVRGVMRNRVVGEGVLFGNLELRWKFLRTTLFNQNVYLALSGFLDGGMVTKKHDFDKAGVPADQLYMVENADEKLHLGAGAGFHFVMNQNFVIAVDYGRALDPGDGESGLYIGLNFLY
jgi:outer membrane protein assembly factor BamA